MTSIIICIVLGGLLVLIVGGISIFISHKNNAIKKLTKKLGQKAEAVINNDINIWSKHTKNKFIKAGLYKYDHNKVFEVDGILVTRKALIVIEIKSIKGEILGGANDPHWIKKVGENSFKIINPITQNDKHIDHIMKMLHLKVPIVSLIIYSNRTGSIKITDQPGHVVITRHAELFNILDEIDVSLDPKLADAQVAQLAKSIRTFRTNKLQDAQLHKSITEQRKKATY